MRSNNSYNVLVLVILLLISASLPVEASSITVGDQISAFFSRALEQVEAMASRIALVFQRAKPFTRKFIGIVEEGTGDAADRGLQATLNKNKVKANDVFNKIILADKITVSNNKYDTSESSDVPNFVEVKKDSSGYNNADKSTHNVNYPSFKEPREGLVDVVFDAISNSFEYLSEAIRSVLKK